MPKYLVSLTVVRTIYQSKSVEIEIEAPNVEDAIDQAHAEAEHSKYHDTDERDWDLESIDSEAWGVEILNAPEEDSSND